MYCKKCGNLIGKDQKFCSSCGTGFFENVEINNQNNVVNNSSVLMQSNKKKNKLYWWVPLLLWFGGIILSIVRVTINLVSSNSYGELEGGILFVDKVLSLLQLCCWLFVFPSIILVIVIYFVRKQNK